MLKLEPEGRLDPPSLLGRITMVAGASCFKSIVPFAMRGHAKSLVGLINSSTLIKEFSLHRVLDFSNCLY